MSTTRDLPRRFSRRLLATTAAAAAISIAGTDACALTINSWTGYPGTDVWGNATNWNQGNVPNSGDQATIYAGPTRLYSAPASIGGLLVSHIGAAGQVFTNGFKLNVLNSISLDGTNAGLYVDNAPSGSVSVQSPLINLTNGGLLDMETSGGKVRVSSTASGTPNGTLSGRCDQHRHRLRHDRYRHLHQQRSVTHAGRRGDGQREPLLARGHAQRDRHHRLVRPGADHQRYDLQASRSQHQDRRQQLRGVDQSSGEPGPGRRQRRLGRVRRR